MGRKTGWKDWKASMGRTKEGKRDGENL